MPLRVLPLGVPTVIAQNEVVALPARLCYITYSVAIEGAQDQAGPWTLEPGAPLAAGGHLAGVNFIRCTTAACTVCCKAQ